MRIVSRGNVLLMLAAFAAGALATILYVREPTEPLTRESLDGARRRWQSAGVSSYVLRYRMHGSEYDVVCRQGRVESVTVNGQTPTSGDWKAYSVDGLFTTLEQELENASDAAGPFAEGAQPVLLRVRFNRELGYVERYLRSSGGIGRGATIDHVALRPAP